MYFGSKNGHLIKYDIKSGFQKFKIPEVNNLILELYSPNHTIWATTNEHTILELDTLGTVLRRIPWKGEKIDHLALLNIEEKGDVHFVVYRDKNKFEYQSSAINYLDLKD